MKVTPITLLRLACLLPLLLAATPAAAGLFWDSEEEKAAKVAKHVADLLREPNRVIAEAQSAAESGDIEEAIRLFRDAQTKLETIEMEEDTSGSAFATLRLKKFHCISMLDALALKRSKVMDVRQAVTDTSDLEARLAAERAKILEAEKPKTAEVVPEHPPTFAEQLETERRALRTAEQALAAETSGAETLLNEATRAIEAFTEAARAHAAADAAAYVAVQNYNRVAAATPELLRQDPDSEYAKLLAEKETKEAERLKANEAMMQAKKVRDELMLKKQAVEGALKKRQAEVEHLRKGVDVLRRTVDKELAEAKAKQEAEQRKLEAETLLKQQQKAAEEARLRAEKAAAEQQAAEAKAKAEADKQDLLKTIGWCRELWHLKNIEALEKELTEAAVRWPDASEFMVLLARVRLLQERADEALEIASTIPAGGECGLQAKLIASAVYLIKGRPLEAMKLLETAMKDAPGNPAPYFNMAITLLKLPGVDPDRAIAARYYTRSVELGGKRSYLLEQRLNMEHPDAK